MATRTHTPTRRWQSDHQRPADNLVTLLNQLASTAPDRILYETVAEGGATRRVTAGGIDQAARDVGARLQRCGAQGARIVVVASNTVECAISYFGCLYAGAVAVLSPAPREVIGAWHLGRVIADAGASRALVSADVLDGYGREQLAGLETLPIVAPFCSADEWVAPVLDAAYISHLQYPSPLAAGGPTVMLTHRNLMHNAELLRRVLQCSADDRLASHAGPNEPLGLVFGLILPLLSGAVSLLPRAYSCQPDPMQWLRLISNGRATIAAASDDVYARCAAQAKTRPPDGIDLVSLRLALHGPSPRRTETVEGFGRVFAEYGFDPGRFYPFHASPEATLIIAGGGRATSPRYATFHADELAEGVARLVRCPSGVRLTSRGQPLPGQGMRIVDPAYGTVCGAGEVGEIWVSSASVAAGYWPNTPGCAGRFESYLPTGEGPFLRTRDRGFLLGGELFILPRRGRLRPFGDKRTIRMIPALALLR